MTLVFVYLLASTLASAVIIDCVHRKHPWTNHGNINGCSAYYQISSSNNDTITQLNIRNPRGNLSGDVGSDEIISFAIESSYQLQFIPRGIDNYFFNLKVLIVMYTGLTTVRQSDFKPLRQLENLYLRFNKQLESIEKDLFKFNRKIRFINLDGNRIATVAYDVFLPLTKLEELNFSFNACYNSYALGLKGVGELKQRIYDRCSPVEEVRNNETTAFPMKT